MKKMTVVLFTLLALTVAALAGAAGTKGSWTGWVTDEHCGAKGANADHQACAEKCAKNGSKLVFYNSADKKIYSLDNQEMAKQNIGHEVKVTGEVDGKNIKVASINPAPPGK
jgi:tRNA isopentenyl-2-thiomethyl-A-37 hydroxylase MiaE